MAGGFKDVEHPSLDRFCHRHSGQLTQARTHSQGSGDRLTQCGAAYRTFVSPAYVEWSSVFQSTRVVYLGIKETSEGDL
jgi:hypothetical protein